VVLVLQHLEVLVGVVEDRRRPPPDVQHRVGVGRARELRLHLLGVVAVDVAVATRPDELAGLQVALLRQHVREQRVAGDVEGFSGGGCLRLGRYAAATRHHRDQGFSRCLSLKHETELWAVSVRESAVDGNREACTAEWVHCGAC
jgi:hypothetical protein